MAACQLTYLQHIEYRKLYSTSKQSQYFWLKYFSEKQRNINWYQYLIEMGNVPRKEQIEILIEPENKGKQSATQRDEKKNKMNEPSGNIIKIG